MESRPWGNFFTLHETDLFKVKQLTVNPGQRLSLQSHECRSEHWYVVYGTAKATVGDTIHYLAVGDAIDIPVGVKHRLENPSKVENLVLIEIQTGSSFDENDIIRYEDDHGRV